MQAQGEGERKDARERGPEVLGSQTRTGARGNQVKTMCPANRNGTGIEQSALPWGQEAQRHTLSSARE